MPVPTPGVFYHLSLSWLDVDECSGEGDCHEYADCIDTDGSFECTCRPGYSGDGFNCSGTYVVTSSST